MSVARRSVPSSFPRNVTGICANLEDFRSYEDELRAADYLLWMATDRRHEVSLPALWPVNVEPLANTVRVLREAQRLRRLIYVSTISVLDQAGQPSSILDQNSVPAPSTDYGRSKLLAEQILLNSGLPVTVLRLPFLYGPGYAARSFLAWYLRLAHGSVMARVNFGARLSLLYTADFGRVAAHIMRRAAGRSEESSSYLVSDGQIYTVNDLIDMSCRLCGKTRPRCLPKAASIVINRILENTRWKYWRHAALDPNFFVVDSSVFHRSFPKIQYTELEAGLRASFSNVKSTRGDGAEIKTWSSTNSPSRSYQ